MMHCVYSNIMVAHSNPIITIHYILWHTKLQTTQFNQSQVMDCYMIFTVKHNGIRGITISYNKLSDNSKILQAQT